MIDLPEMTRGQEAAWRALIAVAGVLPGGWCLVGGQMTHLHCWERGITPLRPTDDADAVLDVRARPAILMTFTSALRDLGFVSAGESWEGHQHRWVNGEAQIDVLIPRGVGQRAASRRGITGGTTLETPGAQAALDRAQPVMVTLGGMVGTILRPCLQGAIVMKAAAYTVWNDRYRDRHLMDLAVLSTLIVPQDRVGEGLTKKERSRVLAAIAALRAHPGLLAVIPEGAQGIARLEMAVSTPGAE